MFVASGTNNLLERPDDLLSKPPPILTPRRNRTGMIEQSQPSIHSKDAGTDHDVFDQKKRVGTFCLEMMTPIKVLKLNRDKKWQRRWLTFSQEGAFLQHSLLTEEQKLFCPEALLWVKKKMTRTTQRKNGVRGGIKLADIGGIRIELIDMKNSHSSKKGTYSNETVFLHIDWRSKNNTTTFLIEHEAGKKIQMGLIDVCSFLMGSVHRKDEEYSNMYVSSPQHMKQDNQNSSPTDVTELLHCLEEKEMDFSPLSSGLLVESHSYHQPCIHTRRASGTREINDLKPKKLIREFDKSGDRCQNILTITSDDVGGNLPTTLEASQANAHAKCEISSTPKERLRNSESMHIISNMDPYYAESKLESQLSMAKLQIESRDVKINNLQKKLYEAVLIEMNLKNRISSLRKIKVIQSLENDVALGETQSHAEVSTDEIVDSKEDACMDENDDASTIPHRQRERQLKDEISRLEILLSNAYEHIDSLSEKVMALELETEGTEEQVLNPTDLNLQLKELKEENIELYKDIESYEIREAEVKEAISRLKIATDTVKSNLEEKKKIIFQLKESSSILEAELAETEAKALLLEEKNVQLAKENSNLRFNISAMTKDKNITIQLYEDKINRLEEGRKEISNDLNSSIDIGIELDHAMERKRAEIANLMHQIEKEKEALVVANTKISELTSANESLTSRNEIQNVVVRRLETEDGALRNEMSTLQGQIENLLKEKESVEEELRILSTDIQTDILQKKITDATKNHEEDIARKSMIVDGTYSDAFELLRSELEDQKEMELKEAADLASKDKKQLSIFYTNKIDTLKSDMEMIKIENTEAFMRIRSQASVIRTCKSILFFLLLVLACREYTLKTDFTRIDCINLNSTYPCRSSTLLDRVESSDNDSNNMRAIDIEGLANGTSDIARLEENQKVNFYNADSERKCYDDSLVGHYQAIIRNNKSRTKMNTLMLNTKSTARILFGTDKVHDILRDVLLYPIP